MAEKVDPAIGRQILETVRENGGKVTVASLQKFKQMVGVNCSMNVFKRELDHQARLGGKLVITRPEADSRHAERPFTIRLAKLPA